MVQLNNALVVGGGLGGMVAALRLAKLGIEVELVEADPTWRPYGAGITITGPSLRAFDDLGVLDQIRARGFIGDGIRIVDINGNPVPEAPSLPGDGLLNATGGILRLHLHEILAEQVRASDVVVRLGVRLEAIEHMSEGARAEFDDGSDGTYELVVAADGISSMVRRRLFPEAPAPQFTGQGCWRVVAPRPLGMTCSEVFVGGPLKLGLMPISQERLYMFILEHVPENPRYALDAFIPHVRRITAPYGGHAAEVRDGIGPDSMINYRPLEWMLVPRPWFRGRVLLIGDAAHATTPQLASGAGMAVEDGIVLAQELERAASVEAALAQFMERRFERVRLVVENSVGIGEIEMSGVDPMRGRILMAESMAALQAPY